MYLVSSSSKFCYYIRRQKSGVATCYVNIGVIYLEVAIEHIFKLRYELNFIKKYIIHFIVYHFRINVGKQCIWVTQGIIASIF